MVGPPTMEQLRFYLPAADVALTPRCWIGSTSSSPRAVTINPDDNSYGEPELVPAARRR